MVTNSKVSVVIPTYKRAHLLGYVLEGLKRQTYKDFDVVIVLKPSGDGTEAIVKNFSKWLDINLVLQKRGYVVDALNLGLEHADGEIIAFLDDDAVPHVDWVQRHVESYKRYTRVGGAAGNVIPARLYGGEPKKVADGVSHIIPPSESLTFFNRVWNAPLEGMEDYFVYISKAGVVEYNLNISQIAWSRPVKSLLGMGANISVLSEAVDVFKFPCSWVLGLAWEQFLGWHLWRNGYNLIFNSKAEVYHLLSGETLTRYIESSRKELLRWIENYLLFYRLYGLEPKLSRMHRVAWFILSSLVDLKKLCVDKEIQRIVRLKGRVYSELIGTGIVKFSKISDNYNSMLICQ